MQHHMHRSAVVAFAVVALSGVALGQAPGAWSTDPANQSNMVYGVYAAAAQGWAAIGLKYAATLFLALAGIDFSVTVISILLSGEFELQGIVVKLIKWIMKTGFFLALLMNGQAWMGAIIGSFIKIGVEASGGVAVTPSAIMAVGLGIAGKLTLWSGALSVMPLIGTVFGLAGMITALLVLIAFVIVALNFVITTIEAYLVLGAGCIFLGFGGSQWTRPYVERYLGLAVSVGTRLMVLYMVVGLGVAFGNQWIAIVNGMLPTTAAGAVAIGGRIATGDAFLDIFGVLAGAFTYAGIAVMCPKLVASVASGALSMSGNDAIGFGVGAAMAGAGLASGGIGAVKGASSILGGGAGGAGAMAGMGGGTLSAGDPIFATSSHGSGSPVAASYSFASSGASSGSGSGAGTPSFGGGSGGGRGQGTFEVGSNAPNHNVDPPNYVAPPTSAAGETGSGYGYGSGADSSRPGGLVDTPSAGGAVAPPANSGEMQVRPASAVSPSVPTVGGNVAEAVLPVDATSMSSPAPDAAVGSSEAPASPAASQKSAAVPPRSIEASMAASRAVDPAPWVSPAGAAGASFAAAEATSSVYTVESLGGASSASSPAIGPMPSLDPVESLGGPSSASSPVFEPAPSVDAAASVSPVSAAPSVVTDAGPLPTSARKPHSLTEKLAALQYVKNITDVGHAVAPPPPPIGKEN